MAFSVNDIKTQMAKGGARPTLFEVNLTNPINGAGDALAPFMIKATSIPASTVGVVEVPYFGRKIKVAGDRTFEDWSVTVMNDEGFEIRNAIEEWSAGINSHVGNIRSGAAGAQAYKGVDAIITQFAKTGEVLRRYSFKNFFPITIGTIDLAWDTNDTIEEFEVTFAYDYWVVSGGSTGTGGTQA